jgi:hypothetical protein
VRRGLLHLTADVPENDILPAWASDPHKRLSASLVVLDDTGRAIETVHFAGAYCVRYAEAFESGDDQLGSYICHFTLSDPDGWTWQLGGPTAYVAPAPREHGTPGAALSAAVAIGGAIPTGPRTLVSPADIPPHLPAPQPNPSPDHAQVHVSQAEWAALIQGRWDDSKSAKNKKFTFMQEHHMMEFHVVGDPFTYRVGADGRMVAVYDAQDQQAYNVTGTRKGLLRIPLTLGGEPTYAGTEHMFPVSGSQKNVVQIKMTGSRGSDFKAANAAAGLTDLVASQGRRPERPPKGYTWHHRDDFVPTTGTPPPYGTCTMELVKEEAHNNTFIHVGSCDQCNEHIGRALYK